MKKWQSIFAIITFLFFCLLWITFDTTFMKAFDQGVHELLYGIDFITMFHYIGETEFIFVIGILLIIGIWFRIRDIKLILFVILTVAFGYGLYQFLKHLIERPRPELVDQFSTFSFPSGHATHGLLIFMTLAFVLSKLITTNNSIKIIWITCIILFVLVGISRITEGRHFTTDVLAGWSIGYSWFIFCVWWYQNDRKKEHEEF